MAESTRMPAWAVLLMHAIPALGVVFFGWSIALVLLFIGLRILADFFRQRPEKPRQDHKPLGARLFGDSIKSQVGDQRADWFEHQQRLLVEDELPLETESKPVASG